MSLCHTRGSGQYRAAEIHVGVYERLHHFDQTRTGVVFCHARSGSADDALPTHPVLDVLAEAGYPVLAVDLGGVATWGNDTAQSALTDARTYLQGTLKAKAGGVFLYCVSMGTLTALNWWRANPTLALGLAGTIPVTDLADMHDNNRSGFATEIETAYTNLAGYNAAVATHNPSANTGSYTGSKIKLWYSTSDTTVVPATVTAFATATGAATQSLGAVGHSPTTDGSEVLAFFDSLGGRS